MQLDPNPPPQVIYLANSGSEANDLALRVARAAAAAAAPGRPAATHVAVMGGAYHGHVTSTMAIRWGGGGWRLAVGGRRLGRVEGVGLGWIVAVCSLSRSCGWMQQGGSLTQAQTTNQTKQPLQILGQGRQRQGALGSRPALPRPIPRDPPGRPHGGARRDRGGAGGGRGAVRFHF
jgi:hypothetical protein